MLHTIIIIIEIIIYTLATMNYEHKWMSSKDSTVREQAYFEFHIRKQPESATTNSMYPELALFPLQNHTAYSDGCTVK